MTSHTGSRLRNFRDETVNILKIKVEAFQTSLVVLWYLSHGGGDLIKYLSNKITVI